MSTVIASGALRKMRTTLTAPVDYYLPLDDQEIHLNPYLGKTVELHFSGAIHCIYCQRKTKKSFNQGYCFPCFKKLARCDTCIVKPEQCHYHEGTCREPEWGEQHCLREHVVYLANSSGVKVGITRDTQVPTRWIDQGAIQALPILRVATRQQSGLVEVIFKNEVADKTNWRAMLNGNVEPVDLLAERDRLLNLCSDSISALQEQHAVEDIRIDASAEPVEIDYPVLEHPTKVSSLNLDKTPEVGGTLMGIKGQYLIFDTGVINIRKYAAYVVDFVA